MKLDWLIFWFSGFATYRLTVLIARDLGPFEIFKWLRSTKRLGGLASCPYCVSVYTGSLVSLGLWYSGILMPIAMWAILSLSFSAISIILDRCFSSDYIAK